MKKIIIPLLAFAFVSCGRVKPLPERQNATVDSLLELNDYELNTEDKNPLAAWSPDGTKILVRSGDGLGLLRNTREQFFDMPDGRRVGRPVWLNNLEFIVGPEKLAKKNPDGSIVHSSGGMVVYKLTVNGIDTGTAFGKYGWRPTLDDENIIAQMGEIVMSYDKKGKRQEIDRGFFPNPQQNGEGMSIQTKPIVFEDYWTGKEGLGELVVTWQDKKVTIHKNTLEAIWTIDGNILATKITKSAKKNQAWHEGETEIVLIKPGGKEIVLSKQARNPAPHPFLKLYAITTKENVVCVIDEYGDEKEVAQNARNPQWNAGGRLMVEIGKKEETKKLKVVSYKVK